PNESFDSPPSHNGIAATAARAAISTLDLSLSNPSASPTYCSFPRRSVTLHDTPFARDPRTSTSSKYSALPAPVPAVSTLDSATGSPPGFVVGRLTVVA